jgi:hypothetical protein
MFVSMPKAYLQPLSHYFVKLSFMRVKMPYYLLTTFGALVALTSPHASAQAPEQPATPRAVLESSEPALAMAALQLNGTIVKGAPFCADTLTESAQTLADGNRITRKHSTRICRDAEGRTRQEVTNMGPQGEVKRVYISDIVTQELWMLKPEKMVAVKLPSLPPPPALPPGLPAAVGAPPASNTPEQQARWRAYAQRLREWARGPQGQSAPAGEQPQAATRPEAVVIAPPISPQDVRKAIEVTRLMGSEGMSPQMFGTMNRMPPGKGQSKALPSKDIESVKAEGTLTTWTIQAGEVGNEKPILVTREEWRSPELKMPLMSRFSDPRSGEFNYRVSNLSRNAPQPELFRVPPDYKIRKP